LQHLHDFVQGGLDVRDVDIEELQDFEPIDSDDQFTEATESESEGLSNKESATAWTSDHEGDEAMF
jgi:hypothetical protein